MITQFDLIVLGGGSGGIAAAVRAASYGAKVAVIERGRLGGTCVNVGCVPKKLMWNAASIGAAIEEGAGYGFDVELRGFDWPTLKRARDTYIERLNAVYARRLESEGIARFEGTARFIGPKTLAVRSPSTGGEVSLGAAEVVIATGGRPEIPSLPGAELGIDSDGFFELEDLPKQVVVVGSGYIAVELAGVLHALGSRVCMVLRRDRVLRAFDEMLSDELMQAMQADGIEIITEANVQRLSRGEEGLEVEISARGVDGDRSSIVRKTDRLLWAIGRRPEIDDLALEVAGVESDSSGAITVDAFQRTSAAGIHAIGDVIAKAPLTPVAIAAGRRLSDRLFGGQADRRLDYENIPTVVFTHPPIATVGASEAEARRRWGNDAIKVYRTRFNGMHYAFSERPRATAMKLVTCCDEERIVGCHIIGHAADEMMQGFAVAVRMGARKRDFDDTVAIHPTSAEEMVTMR
ncbi:glutathione-disulfide reductase [Thioalkalivibrio sp. HK1]|uniref:glutathione-disulfide reductase n=1 Tax=Thioalkalivibrio sp. HK1 TaxID=1469245 RepID=UPI000471F130|nr:glutathione-disulfide reductase [Thioalkalivibrio sp. HK1]